MSAAIILLVLVIVVCGLGAIRRASRGSVAHRELLRLALGDREKVDRLIAFERERHPAASHTRLIRHAIDRWHQDNR